MKMKHIKTDVAPVSGQHTSTPWHFADDIYHIGSREFIGIGNGAEHIGYVSVTACVRLSEAKANAEFIVRACNCHDELVKAVKDLLDGYEEGDENWQIEQARAALNKASR